MLSNFSLKDKHLISRLLRAITQELVTIFAVSPFIDNGIGFKEKYLDRIFTVFQRLHKNDEYEGTGIGLAICRRIVELHNGRIWATSKPNKGSTFFVELPKIQ